MRINISLFSLFLIVSTSLFSQKQGSEYVNPPITIVVLGSSTAEGVGTKPRDSSWVNRYRTHVQSFNPNNQVINLGKGGFSTYQVQPTTDEYPRNRPKADTTRNFTKALQYKPDGIIINLPSNDVADGNSLEEQLNNFRILAQLAEENDIELWVCTTQARNFPKARDRQYQRDLYDSLRSIFYSNYIDFWTGFCDGDFRIMTQYDSGDGCHMNNGAHAILMDRVVESQAFALKLEVSSMQESTTKKPKEQKPPYMQIIGFDGKIERLTQSSTSPTRVEIVQNNKIKGVTEVRDSNYTIETLIDLRVPLQVIFRDSNTLTKIVEFDFLQKAFTQNQYNPTAFYPVEALDITEIPVDVFNYRFPNNELVVARFTYDSLFLGVQMDTKFVVSQRQRLEDALLKSENSNKLKLYWANGEKKAVLKFKNGSLHGKSTWYRDSGKLERIVYFSIGKYHGKYIDFDESGKKKMIRIYQDDREVGPTVIFD